MAWACLVEVFWNWEKEAATGLETRWEGISLENGHWRTHKGLLRASVLFLLGYLHTVAS